MNVFLANVGNRDVWIDTGAGFYSFSKGEDGTHIAKHLGCKRGTRHLSLHVLSHLEQFKDSLHFPILNPSLTAALERVSSIDRLILFATDQQHELEEHKDWDTIESARLIDLRFQDLFAEKIGKLEIVTVNFNPSHHDRAYEFLGEALRDLVPESADAVFASIKGGIPAMNAALRERVVHRYGKRAWLIETDEPPEGKRWEGVYGEARIISSWLFRRDAVLRLLKSLLDRSDYSGALRLLELEGIQTSEVHAFLKHALARMNLDFRAASSWLDGLTGSAYQWKVSAEDAWGLQRLADVAHTAHNALEREDYGVFLSRVATFCENCRRLLCWVLTGVRAESGGISFSQVAQVNNVLAEHLRSRDLSVLNKQPHNPVWKVDRDFFSSSIEWGRQNNPSAEFLVDAVRGNLGKLRGLENLRNEIEHLMQGVSREDIQHNLPNPETVFPELSSLILDNIVRLKRILTGSGAGTLRNIFSEVNAAAIQELVIWNPRRIMGNA